MPLFQGLVPTPRHQRKSMGWVLAVYLLAALAGIAIGYPWGPYLWAWFGWITAGLLSAVVLPRLVLTSRFPPSLDLRLVALGLTVLYGLVLPLANLRNGNTWVDGFEVARWYPNAIALSALAAIGLLTGAMILQERARRFLVELPSIPSDRTLPRTWKRRTLPGASSFILVWCAAVGAILHFGGVRLRLLPTIVTSYRGNQLSGYLTYAPQYLYAMGLYVSYVSSHRTQRRLATGACAVAVGIFALSGTRYTVIVGVLAWVIAGYWKRHPKGSFPLALAGALLLVSFVTMGLIGQYRSSGYAPITTDHVLDRSSTAFEIFNPLAGQFSYVEAHGHTFGSTYTYLFSQVVPRSLWPEKPNNPISEVINQYTDPRAGRAFPVWGEMYLNFGWWGVVVGAACMGALLTAIQNVWRLRRNDSPVWDLVAALSVPLVLQWISRGYAVQLVYNTAAFLVPLLVIHGAYRSRVRCRHGF